MKQIGVLIIQIGWNIARAFSGLYFEIQTTITDFVEDTKLGIETMGWYNTKDSSLFNDSSNYLPTKYFILKETVKHVDFKENDVLIDIGCGKGRVISFFSSMKIKKIIGIEINNKMYNIALLNVSRLKKKLTLRSCMAMLLCST